jgi:ABC-type phosphate transport system permease subunit
MTLKDTIWCATFTAVYILVISIFNGIFETNYISTTKMPAHLINYVGLNLPDWLCLPSVIVGYVFVTFFQWWVSNKTIKYQAKLNRGD